jgi:hypothetical protein
VRVAGGQVDFLELVGEAVSARNSQRSLQQLYNEWRAGYTVSSPESEWRRGLESLHERQVERYLAALTMLEVRRPPHPP